MELEEEKKEKLIKALAVIKKIPNVKNLPILNDTVRLVSNNGDLHLYETDLITVAIVNVGYVGLPDFEVIISLSDFSHAMKYKSPLNIDIFGGDNLIINGIVLRAIDKNENYPEFITEPVSWSGHDNGELCKAMKYCAEAIYKDDGRCQLTYINFDAEKKEVACTDGHRLHVTKIDMNIPKLMIDGKSFISISSKVKINTKTEYQQMGNKFCIIQGNVKWMIRTSDEYTFPKYNNLWYNHTTEATFQVKELKNQLKLISKTRKSLKEYEKPIIFDTKNNNFTFNELFFPAIFSYKSDRVGVSPKYLLEAIKHLDDNQEVVIGMAKSNNPVIIISCDKKSLIMPMRIVEEED